MPPESNGNLADDIARELERMGGADKKVEVESSLESSTEAREARLLGLAPKEEPEHLNEVEDEQQEEDSEGDGEGKEAASPPKQNGALVGHAKKLGYDVDDEATDEEIAEALFARLAKLEQATKEAERKAQEAAQKAQEVAAKKPEPEPEKKTEQPKRDRKFGKLNRPDPALNALVEYDEETRQYIGKDKFGVAGVEAAKQFNDYAAEHARRSATIIEDPSAIIEDYKDDLKADVEQLLEARLKERLEQIKQEQQQTVQQTTAEQENQKFVDFMESVKDKLYKLNPNGTPRVNFDNEPAWTEAGKLFLDEYNDLLAINPNAPPLVIAQKAYKLVEKMTSLTPVKSKAEVATEKKKSFVAKGRKHETGVPSSGNSATVQDKFNSGNKARLWEALLEDPDNDDNPELASYRK